jgi:hypothetical protein
LEKRVVNAAKFTLDTLALEKEKPFPPESLQIIEYNLSFDKSNWFSITQGEVEDIKGTSKGASRICSLFWWIWGVIPRWRRSIHQGGR